uniref:non-specific serine/threonine protein kinase n=1 Tax=Araucaria cunninghamii TaxID=56994 RepID=A0A0D6R5G0_ARACU
MTRSNSFVGTEEYVSPEMLQGDGHDFAVDWWALGILLYEMLYGKTPFKGATRKETFYYILVRQPQFAGPWTPLRDLIMRLLDKEPLKRLGSANGASEVKSHLFFRGLEWEALENVSTAPFVPPPVSFEDMSPLDSLDVNEYLDKQTDLKEKKKSNGSKDENSAEKKADRHETEAFKVF